MALLPCWALLLPLAGCSLVNPLDDVVRPSDASHDVSAPTQDARDASDASDEGDVVDEGDGGAADEPALLDVAADTSVTVEAEGPKDVEVEAEAAPLPPAGAIVISGQQVDAGTDSVIAVLDPETGLQKGNRDAVTIGYKVAGIVYDGVREDTYYIFEQSADDYLAPARVRVRTLNPRTGQWKDVATVTGLPPPTGGPEFTVLDQRIAYFATLMGDGGNVSTGIAFLNTEDLHAIKVLTPPGGISGIMPLPFKSIGMVGIPTGVASQRLEVVRRLPEPGMVCTGAGPGGGTNFCDLALHRITLTSLGISTLEATANPVGQYPAADSVRTHTAGGASWTADLVGGRTVVAYPPPSFDATTLEGLGSLQAYDINHQQQITPARTFGPVKGPWLRAVALAQCERVAFTMEFITTPELYAVPFDPTGTVAVVPSISGNGGFLVFEPIARTLLAPNGKDLRAYELGGTAQPGKPESAPTLQLRTPNSTRKWSPPLDINIGTVTVKAPLVPSCP